MKKYLYVDTENTGLSFIRLISRMGKSWKVMIFYSSKSPKLSFEEMDLISEASCGISFVPCRNGRPNAMDFCIMTRLGMNVERHPKAMHLILSRDKGYLSGIDLLRERGFYVGEIVLDEMTHAVSWVSTADGTKPYDRVREYFDSLFALDQLPREGLVPQGGLREGTALLTDTLRDGESSGVPAVPADGTAAALLPVSAGSRRRRRGGRRRNGGDADTGVAGTVLEKKLIEILIEHFDAVGVDRQRKLMGQVMKRGLQNAFQNGELHFDLFSEQLRKFAVFKEDDDAIRKLLGMLEEISGLLISGAENWYGSAADEERPETSGSTENGETEASPAPDSGAESEGESGTESIKSAMRPPGRMPPPRRV